MIDIRTGQRGNNDLGKKSNESHWTYVHLHGISSVPIHADRLGAIAHSR